MVTGVQTCALPISLGAVVGDFLDKPLAKGGLNLSRYSASAALVVLIVACILIFKQSPRKKVTK